MVARAGGLSRMRVPLHLALLFWPAYSYGAAATTMQISRYAIAAYIAAGLTLLTGCSPGLSEIQVQAMIDKSISKHLAKQGQAEPQPAAAPSFEPPEPRSEHSAQVDSDLNDADLAFRDRNESLGCNWVSNAITKAGNESVSEDQARQLKAYAQRCGLRY